jgi:drug/metabolite transporter (DMT)-like permease
MNTLRGQLAIIGYNVFTAAHAVLLGRLINGLGWDPIDLIFWTFLIVALTLNGLALRAGGPYTRRLRSDLPDVVALNAVSAVNWITYFLAIRTVPVSIHASLALGIGPLVVLAWEAARPLRRWNGETNTTGKGDRRSSLRQAVAPLALGGTVLVLAVYQALRGTPGDVLLSITCGVSLVGTLTVQQRMYRKGWPLTDLMACRFILLLAVAAAMTHRLRFNFETSLMAALLALAAGVAIPVFLLTYGQVRCTKLRATTLLATLPAFMVSGEWLEGRVPMHSGPMIGVAAASIFLLITRRRPAKEAAGR